MYKVLFVCTGNICRSPTAEGVLRKRAHDLGLDGKLMVDSAGTHAYHVGEAPDLRSIATAKKRGVLIDGLRARKIEHGDFHEFNLILGLDYEHLQHLRRIAPADATANTALFLDFAGHPRAKEVPDPYYSDQQHFEYVLDLIESGVDPLLDKLKPELE